MGCDNSSIPKISGKEIVCLTQKAKENQGVLEGKGDKGVLCQRRRWGVVPIAQSPPSSPSEDHECKGCNGANSPFVFQGEMKLAAIIDSAFLTIHMAALHHREI